MIAKPSTDAAKAVLELDRRLKLLERFAPLTGRVVDVEVNDQFVRVPHGLGRSYSGFICLDGMQLVDDKAVKRPDKEIWLRRTSPWTLLEHKSIGADTGSVLFEDLDGDLDRVYYLEGYVLNSVGGSQTYNLEPNSSSSSQDGQQLLASNTTVSGAGFSTLPFFSGSATEFSFDLKLWAATGAYRQYVGNAVTSTSTPATTFHGYSGTWRDDSDKITTLELTQSNTSIGAGSEFWLYALGNRITTTKVWVF